LSRSEATGERLKEAQHINKSLSALGDVVSSLQTRSPHVPYRNSKLTSLLQGALGRSGKALIFMHVSPTEGSARRRRTRPAVSHLRTKRSGGSRGAR
jgi:kinesin family protein C2/C3